jgi:L-glyceraldehyde 3-phosphate reductase
MKYVADSNRYENMKYNRCGRSGLMLPAVSLGLWHNFGGVDTYTNSRDMILKAFDLGITHFDNADCYGPPSGSAEDTMGQVMKNELSGYRDELCISTKAGWGMWRGPYGDFGSKKHMVASLDQSLKRLGVDYVDIYYHHRPDPETPLEETMGALDSLVRSGKALYVGISEYPLESFRKAAKILKEMGTPMLINQAAYNMMHRWVENGLFDILDDDGIGCIAFIPLAQGILTNKYLNGIPEDSRAAKAHGHLQEARITEEKLAQVKALYEIANNRGQSLAQMAIAWTLRDKRVTSALIGASSTKQIEENLGALNNLEFTNEELEMIDKIVGGPNEFPSEPSAI